MYSQGYSNLKRDTIFPKSSNTQGEKKTLGFQHNSFRLKSPFFRSMVEDVGGQTCILGGPGQRNFPNKCQCCPQPGSRRYLGRSTDKSYFTAHLFSMFAWVNSNWCVVTKGGLEGSQKPGQDKVQASSLCAKESRATSVLVSWVGFQREGRGRRVCVSWDW